MCNPKILSTLIHKEEALSFRVAKVSKVSEAEKELASEISALEKQKEELEAELQKPFTPSQCQGRERDQLDEYSDQIVAHLKTKEDELSKSISSYRAEADVVNTWISFLEETWELAKYGDHFLKLVIRYLSAYEVLHLTIKVSVLLDFWEEMSLRGNSDNSIITNSRKRLAEEYLDFESKMVTTFNVVDDIKEQFYAQREKLSWKNEPRVKELLAAINQIKEEFESIERPVLQMKKKVSTPKAVTPSRRRLQRSFSELPAQRIEVVPVEKDEDPHSSLVKDQGH
ncbi:hypothetical protein MKX01_027926 [Papaver californicum]|nr:hypothetical protein MKX01_027926 [Papaver californicum]